MPRIPTSTDQITPDWLADQLRSAGAINGAGHVAAVDIQPLELQGALSQTVRLRPRYDAATTGPDAIIAKLSTANAAVRAVGVQRGLFRSEVMFYRTLAPALGDSVPRCYGAEVSNDGAQFALLLEDVSPHRTVEPYALASDDARLAIDHLASIHTTYWESAELNEHAWLRSLGTEKAEVEQSRSAMLDAASASENRFGWLVPDVVPEALRLIAEQLEKIQRHRETQPVTLVHGDYHTRQMLFPGGDGGRFVVIDWQTVAASTGVSDLTRTLVMGFTPEGRRAAEPELLDRYHRTLQRRGVSNYGREQLFTDYAFSMWVNVPILVMLATALPDEWIESRRERMAQLGEEADPIGTIFGALAASIEDHRLLQQLSDLG